MDWTGWATFGFVATAALTIVMVGAQILGRSRMDLPLMLGTVFAADPDRARILGILAHLVAGQTFALMYVAAFAHLGFATWWLGLAFGLGHGAAAVFLIIPLLPTVHPRMASERSGLTQPAALEPPGPLALNYGRETPLVALVAHALFGLLLGVLISPS